MKLNRFICVSLFSLCASVQAQTNAPWDNGLKQLMGCEVQADDELAMKLLQAQAEQGSAVAQVTLGAMLASDSDSQDLVGAKKWFELAATQGNLQAQNELVSLATAAGDKDKQAYWQKMADAQSRENRFARLSKIALADAKKWATQTPGKATAKIQTVDNQTILLDVRTIGKAVESDNDAARTVGAWLLATGNGTKKNPKIAIEWLEKAARNNYVPAQTILGELYRLGWEDLSVDTARGAILLSAAAKNQYAPACVLYGTMLINGEGVPQDKAQGMQYLQVAAKSQDPVAILMIAMADMASGNREVAAKGFCTAAQKGDDTVQSIIGSLYGGGSAAVMGESEKLTEARRFAQRGETEAQVMLGLLYAEGWGTARDIEKAKYWFERAQAKNDTDALLPLALLYAEENQDDKAQALLAQAQQKKADTLLRDEAILQLMFDRIEALPVDDLFISTDKQAYIAARQVRINRKVAFIQKMTPKYGIARQLNDWLKQKKLDAQATNDASSQPKTSVKK